MKMFLEILLLVIAIVVIVFLFFYSAEILLSPSSQQASLGSVCVKPSSAKASEGEENCFDVELAKTEVQREKGLMYREKLDKNKGMLFIFDKEGIYPFWMKNTLIPLDMIWINSGNKAVFISQNVQPCKSPICPSVYPQAKAKYVLEINAGICEEIGLEPGDDLELNIK